jgi:hypothetical protein
LPSIEKEGAKTGSICRNGAKEQGNSQMKQRREIYHSHSSPSTKVILKILIAGLERYQSQLNDFHPKIISELRNL